MPVFMGQTNPRGRCAREDVDSQKSGRDQSMTLTTLRVRESTITR